MQLWPENPAYQVYIPGYHHHSLLNPGHPHSGSQQQLSSLYGGSTSMIHHNMGLATQHQHQHQNRARSTSPTGAGAVDVLNHDPAASNFQRADGASR